jgi:hypothetical protein
MRSAPADLFLTFAKIGLFTFGGGYAMLPLIEKEAVDNKKWITDNELLDVVAIAESTPGPIAINAATFIGKKVGGFIGALCATTGVVLPSFIIITRLPSRNASPISWVTNRNVLSSPRWREISSSCNFVRVMESIAPKGSSRSIIFGSTANARAKPTRCC